jgi:poly(3-hydroxybutyrate) depolymerase
MALAPLLATARIRADQYYPHKAKKTKMLYKIHEAQSAAMRPVLQWSQVAATMLSNPGSPFAYTPFSQEIAASCELMYRLGKNYDKPRFAIESTRFRGKEVGICETIVSTKPFCVLRHFAKQLDDKELAAHAHPTVLLVAPLSGHYATLLRDTVKGLLHDHDVYITDWADARNVPLSEGAFHLDDFVHYVQDFIRLLGPDVHVVAICQPTVPVLAAVSLMASNGEVLPLSMTLMGGPIDGRISPTKVNQLATEKPHAWFENNVICTVPDNYPGAGRRVYPGFLQYAGFVAMHPDKHQQSYIDFFKDRAAGRPATTHLKFYDEYNAVLDMAAEFYLETIKVVFQDFDLARGAWDVDGKRVRPQDIQSTALFTIEGGKDDICGLGQTMAAHALCCAIPQSKKRHLTVPESGHFGIFSGHRWHEEVCPKLAEFIREHGKNRREVTPNGRAALRKMEHAVVA